MTLDAMEVLVTGRGRELLRGLVQLALDAQAEREVRLPEVTGEDGVRRARAERGHGRPVVTRLGEVRGAADRLPVRGQGGGVAVPARCGAEPAAAAGIPGQLQRLAEMFCRSGSYEQAHEFVLAATGVSVGKRQLEQIVAAAAADAERFCQDRAAVPRPGSRSRGRGREQGLPPLAISADGKGVAMLPGGAPPPDQGPGAAGADLRQAGRDRGEERLQADGRDRGVFDVAVPDGPAADPGAGHAPGARQRPGRGPRAENRWYACDITAGRDVTIGKVFAEADRRDPGHARTWIALVDGDNHQLGLIQAQAAARGITLAIVIDFIHVLEYLWKAAWCFHPPRDPAMEDWVIAQAPGHPARPRRRGHHPDPGPRRRAPAQARQRARQDHPQDPVLPAGQAGLHGLPARPGRTAGRSPPASSRAPAATWSHDRMGITGARWGLEGAQAILWLRAINASGDTSAYWD